MDEEWHAPGLRQCGSEEATLRLSRRIARESLPDGASAPTIRPCVFDLTDLRLFLHVAEAESITRGAERAGLALASASERIRGMELAGGVPLLERHPRGVRPTPAGLAVVHHARLMLGQLEQMRGELGQYAAACAAMSGSCRSPRRRRLAAGGLVGLPRRVSHHRHRLGGAHSREGRRCPGRRARRSRIVADTTDLGALETLAALSRPDRPGRAAGACIDRAERGRFREVLDEPLVGLSHCRSLQDLSRPPMPPGPAGRSSSGCA